MISIDRDEGYAVFTELLNSKSDGIVPRDDSDTFPLSICRYPAASDTAPVLYEAAPLYAGLSLPNRPHRRTNA